MIPPEKVQNAPTGSRWHAPLVTLAFLAFFLLLPSQQYFAVDGPLRCLQVFHDRRPSLHGNNHLLYPFWIWVWTRAAALIGYTPADWSQFIRLCQAMNSVCAAVAIGVLFSVLASIAGTWYALLGALQFGLSTAVVLHATNSAEPPTGLLFSLLAVGIVIPALRAGSRLRLFLVGVLLAMALASYQPMALVAPAIAVVCACWPGGDGARRWQLAVARLCWVGCGGLLSVVAIYGLAYSSVGTPPAG